jgi:hypothetical protein
VDTIDVHLVGGPSSVDWLTGVGTIAAAFVAAGAAVIAWRQVKLARVEVDKADQRAMKDRSAARYGVLVDRVVDLVLTVARHRLDGLDYASALTTGYQPPDGDREARLALAALPQWLLPIHRYALQDTRGTHGLTLQALRQAKTMEGALVLESRVTLRALILDLPVPAPQDYLSWDFTHGDQHIGVQPPTEHLLRDELDPT